MPLRSVWCALWQADLNPNPNPSLNPKGRAVRVLGRRQPSRQRHQEVAARATPTSRPVGGCVDTRLSSPSPGASTPRVPASCMPWVGDYCTYGPRVPAFLCGARTGGTGQLALGGGLLYVRVPASGVPYAPHSFLCRGTPGPSLHRGHHLTRGKSSRVRVPPLAPALLAPLRLHRLRLAAEPGSTFRGRAQATCPAATAWVLEVAASTASPSTACGRVFCRWRPARRRTRLSWHGFAPGQQPAPSFA